MTSPMGHAAGFLYVGSDVAVVYFLSAAPLAALFARYAQRRVSAAASFALSIGCLGASLAVAGVVVPSDVELRLAGNAMAVAFFRAAAALGLATAAALAAAAFDKLRVRRDQTAAAALFAAAALLLVPATYVDARLRHDSIRLAGLLQQSRLGEARRLVRDMLRLAPEAEYAGRSLQSAAADIERAASELESRVAAPSPISPDDRWRLDRARDLAMLGRAAEAIETLEAWTGWLHSPPALNLAATIQETNCQWRSAIDFYRASRRAWEAASPGAERDSGWVQAATGIAFCERRLGHLAEAEAAYRERLALSPTAKSHFLLASFYEDTQQSAQARVHAHRAMELSPERYREQARKLIDKLDSLHFGCLSGFVTDSKPTGNSFSAEGVP